jgi:hypothetical protein
MRDAWFRSSWTSVGAGVLAGFTLLQISGCGANVTSAVSSATGSGGNAKQNTVAAPLLGYVWDATGQVLRGISGVPGSTKLDTLPGTGLGFATAVAAGSHAYALLLDGKGALYLATLPAGTPQELAAGPWTGVAISAGGGYAVAYGGATPQLISGLPSQPAFHDLDARGMSVVSAAVNDNGAALLGAPGNGGVTILAVGQGASATPTLTIGAVGGMAFVPGSDRALVVDAATGSVTQIANVSSGPAPAVVSGATISQPVGLDVSADGRWALVANGAGTVVRLDISGQSAPVTAKCSCTPTTVANLSGTAFLLTGAGSSTGWMVDAGGGSGPRFLFIPALPSVKVAGGAQ